MHQFTKIYFKVAQIVSLILAILLSITIIGIIIGIPLFIASGKFKEFYTLTDEKLVERKNSILGWGIFLSIVLAPSIIGLIVMLVIVIMVNSYIGNIERGEIDKAHRTVGQTIQEGTSSAWNSVKNTFKGKSDLDKQKEELAKLQKMLEENLITQEEYEIKRRQILGL